VVATPARVALRVSSTGPAGTYLNYQWAGGGGGAPAPAAPATWHLNAPPGELHLSCSTSTIRGAPKVVTVSDPSGFWSTTTLADLGCRPGATPSWVGGPGHGATADDAVINLLKHGLKLNWVTSPVVAATRASIGYADGMPQTWIATVAGKPYLTALVSGSSGNFTADPDAVCAAN
jgi:hypothetical protein